MAVLGGEWPRSRVGVKRGRGPPGVRGRVPGAGEWPRARSGVRGPLPGSDAALLPFRHPRTVRPTVDLLVRKFWSSGWVADPNSCVARITRCRHGRHRPRSGFTSLPKRPAVSMWQETLTARWPRPPRAARTARRPGWPHAHGAGIGPGLGHRLGGCGPWANANPDLAG